MNELSYTVRPYRPGDETRILELFNRVFGEGDPSFRPRTLEQWNWEFRDNPAGNQIIVAEAADGRVIAQYACLPARAQIGGERVTTGQGIDSMVHPEFRRGLKKEGPFLQVARRYFEIWGNERANAYGFGFPNTKAFRVGVRLIGYVPVDHALPTLYRNFFAQPDDDAVGRAHRDAAKVREISSFDARADRLWELLLPHYPVAIVRDSTYLNWRYARCPYGRYRMFEVCDGGELRALFVTRSGWQGLPILALADFVAHPKDEAAVALALRQSVRCARDDQQVRVEAWFPKTGPMFAHAKSNGFDSEPSTVHLCLMLYRKDVEFDWFTQHWYYTIGDGDLF